MPYLTLSDSKSFLMESKTGKLRAGWINYFAQGHKQVDLWVGTEMRLGLHHLSSTVKHQQMHRKAGIRVAPAEAPPSPASSLGRNDRKYESLVSSPQTHTLTSPNSKPSHGQQLLAKRFLKTRNI